MYQVRFKIVHFTEIAHINILCIFRYINLVKKTCDKNFSRHSLMNNYPAKIKDIANIMIFKNYKSKLKRWLGGGGYQRKPPGCLITWIQFC